MTFLRFFVFVFLFSCSLQSFTASAQEAFDAKAMETVLTEQKTALESADKLLSDSNANLDQKDIYQLRQSLRASRDALQGSISTLRPVYDSIQAEISDLGPAPSGETPEAEPENIQRQRADLAEKSLNTEGFLKEAEALASKTARLLEKVVALRRSQFVNRLFEPQMSAFDMSLWSGAFQAYTSQVLPALTSFNEKFKASQPPLIIVSVILVLLLGVSNFISRRTLHANLKLEDREKFSEVSRSLIMPFLAVGFGLLITLQTLIVQLIATGENWTFCLKISLLVAFFILVLIVTSRLAKAKIIRHTMRWLSSIVALIFVVDAIILDTGRMIGAPLEVAIAQSYISTTLFAVMLGFLSFVITKKGSAEKRYFLPKQVFYFFCGVSVLILTANIFGYAAFTRFIFERVVLLSALLTLALLIRAIIRPYFKQVDKLLSSKKSTKKDDQEHLILFWLSLSLDTVLFFLTLPLIAGTMGADWNDIQEWTRQAFFGLKIGNVTISMANIVIAIATFLVLLFLTRFVQNVLSEKILPKTKMEASVRQSVTQVLGYIGLIFALLAGVSAIGFDLTNLALIAGALSVGIGFGLQSIVSNFVSGLILLFERPIKVGDWIITSSGEGIVKKISVRSTEIETFDRTSIIVPNSELISSSVKNWTHKDKIGRVVIMIGVSYDSDPHKVKELLIKCGEESEYSLKTPGVSVFFKDFGDNALIFELRFFIRNVTDTIMVATQMRFDIWDAFKEADIEISFPQRDLHIRSAPGLEGLFKDAKK